MIFVNYFKYISLECEGLSGLNFFDIICQHLDNREKNCILNKNRSSPNPTSITDGFFFDIFERLHVVEFHVIKTNGMGKSLKAVLLR